MLPRVWLLQHPYSSQFRSAAQIPLDCTTRELYFRAEELGIRGPPYDCFPDAVYRTLRWDTPA